mmetsp:Transcript_3225/g.6494  ORF Transcript_3225/g.6494 Transcript_3225/m.6494 type:complete len:195 (-) Transcript_3225:223-807(-)
MTLLKIATLLCVALAATGENTFVTTSSSAVDQTSSAVQIHEEINTRELGVTNFLRKLTKQSAIPSSESHTIDNKTKRSSRRRRLGWWYDFFMEHFYPSLQPSRAPTMTPTAKPTARPSESPSVSPTLSYAPSSRPSPQPSPNDDRAIVRLEPTTTSNCPRIENCFNVKKEEICNCQSHCKWANIGIEVCMPYLF